MVAPNAELLDFRDVRVQVQRELSEASVVVLNQ